LQNNTVLGFLLSAYSAFNIFFVIMINNIIALKFEYKVLFVL